MQTMQDWINRIIHSPGGFLQWEIDSEGCPHASGIQFVGKSPSYEERLAHFVIGCLTNPNNVGSEAIIQEIVKRRYEGSMRPKFLTEIKNVLIVVNCFSEQIGPGSTPDIQTFVFTDQDKLNDFIADWKMEQEAAKREPVENELKYYGAKDWVYSLEIKYLEVNCSYAFGKIFKRY